MGRHRLHDVALPGSPDAPFDHNCRGAGSMIEETQSERGSRRSSLRRDMENRLFGSTPAATPFAGVGVSALDAAGKPNQQWLASDFVQGGGFITHPSGALQSVQ